ncbi:hypothetical protein DCAR_0314325 [Daucus carota subsp. sativus]|uniref:PPPDE domain-containing protein n=1 Tax=Daucus carota subsp. sativus TaxID=79200 RepID=A0A169WHE8_DAUCS|nr:PREDICTED: desumoylating isopeptidase 1 [Daucus carota subsp. sativus]WOG95023.1 hypothetical protein DCAR_0314325 [Daucus carota subsp. sativus]
MAEEGHKVSLNVYDLSQGMARNLSMAFLGKTIEGIWHTGIVVYGTEYYFSGGVQHAPVGTTPYGTPIRVVDIGVTHVPKDVFEMYLEEISPRYTAESYSLLKHNCNNFSNEVAQFLAGATIPEYILNLPNEVTSSPMAALILPMIERLETTMKAGAVPQAPQFQQPILSTPANNVASSGVKKEEKKPEVTKPKVEEKPVKSGAPNTSAASTRAKPADPLGDARSKVQEEITNEFAAIMASGTLRASEAAALATKRVMQRYGSTNSVQS